MITLLQTPDIVELADTLHHGVETILVEDKSPIGSFNWSNAIIAFFGALASVLALFPSWWTMVEQKRVANNTQLLNIEVQYEIIINLILQLYRNMVIIWAISNKIRLHKYTSYPSAVHFLKAKISLDDLHLELFLDDKFKYGVMNELATFLRNYNIELDVANTHLSDKKLSEQVKNYEISTLLFKPGFLANKIVLAMQKIYPEKRDEIIRDVVAKIQGSHNKNKNKNNGIDEDLFKNFVPYENRSNDFLSTIFAHSPKEFFEMFNSDALIECGINSENTDKILMIRF